MGPDAGRGSYAFRVAPFAAAAVLVWAAVIVGSSIDWALYALSVALLLLAGAVRFTPFGRRFEGALSSLVFLGAVAVLRDSAGGSGSGVAVVSLIPVFYTALYGRRLRWLCAVLGGVAVFYLAPIVLVGPPAYPSSQYRAALLTVLVAAIIGLATRRLVNDVRHQVAEAVERERMLGLVNDVVRSLFGGGSQSRLEVCEAARTIGAASMAVLYEPVHGTSAMRATAISGADADPIEISTLRRSAVTEAFASGQPRMITEDVEAHVGSLELWVAAGRPESILYEPLSRAGEPVGVLVVGWPANVKAEDPRATVVALLAHEAAAVIASADALSELTDMASTDPLTGLPNRRAWDARVAGALAADQRFTIAMFDLDHFKEFNDAHGHPAGDRLLKQTAAVWREQVRSGDLLARLGGEEFGLLLFGCNHTQTLDVLERLRGAVYHDRTCSVGFAVYKPEESAEQVLARADAALYEAKQSGRDRVCMSA